MWFLTTKFFRNIQRLLRRLLNYKSVIGFTELPEVYSCDEYR